MCESAAEMIENIAPTALAQEHTSGSGRFNTTFTESSLAERPRVDDSMPSH